MLEIKGLSVGHDRAGHELRVVQDLSFTLRRGQRLALVGESGSGKSMTALAVTGLLPRPFRALTGTFLLDGNAYDPTSPAMRSIRGRDIAMIFQDPDSALDPVMTVGDQVVEAIRAHARLDYRAARQRAADLLEKVHIPDARDRLDADPHEFSGGMRQRVMIASALAHDPDVLIADEPTTALDVSTQLEILRLIDELCQADGTGLLLITHDFGLVGAFCDEAIVMRDGRVVEVGRVAQVLTDPQHDYTAELLKAVPPIGRDVEWLGTTMPGRVRTAAAEPVAAEPAPVLKLSDVTLAYHPFGGAEVLAARDVSLELRRGRTLGLVGQSGSGKTTLSRGILGLVEPVAGTIELFGEDIARFDRAQRRRMRRRVQMVFQDPFTSLDPMMSVGRIVAEPLLVHGIGSRRSRRERAIDLLRQVDLPESYIDRRPAQLSGGQRQRVAIARALALEPDLIICDEPVSALDVSVQATVLNMLKRLSRELHLTMLFISHDLAVIRFIADEVAVIRAGQIVEHGEKADILDRPSHSYTRELIAASRLDIGRPSPAPTQTIGPGHRSSVTANAEAAGLR